MKWRDVLFLACLLVLSVGLQTICHYAGSPAWLVKNLPATSGGDGILWQVQTTFLSVGFAGLAIAAQLFADAPLAIGASRGRVLEYVRTSWFVGVGLVANAVIAIETIWLPSALGLLVISVAWFVSTVVLLVVSTVRLTQLFGHPSMLDEVVRRSLVEALSDRLGEVSRKYADATRELHEVVSSSSTAGSPRGSTTTLRVPVPEVGRVVKGIKSKPIRQAIASLSLRATEEEAASSEPAVEYITPQLTLGVDPGDRTRLGDTAFRVTTSKALNDATSRKVVRLLQSSIEFESPGSVTPYEESDREIANLKDAIGTNLRSGALATAERALELLGQVVRGVWMAEPEKFDTSRRSSYTRSDWLFRSIGEVEQDVLLSPRVAGIFVGAAMTRAIEAPRTGSVDYVDECLRSFTRLWFDVLAHGGPEFEAVPSRITTCIQNLAAYTYSNTDDGEDLRARGIWTMVELVKLALDARKPEASRMAAEELNGLFEFEREGSSRNQVRGGQLVLSGWLDYLAATRDERDPADSSLRALVTPRGSRSDILAARRTIEQGSTRFSRWDWWEVKSNAPSRVQTLQLSSYVDRAQVAALASARGPLPPVRDQETASEYERFLNLLRGKGAMASASETHLEQRIAEEVGNWNTAEDGRLAQEPLSDARIEELRAALRDTLTEHARLALKIPTGEEAPPAVDDGRPILGMNFRIPRSYLVDKIFNQTYANPNEIGQIVARGFSEGEEQKITNELREMQVDAVAPTTSMIRKVIEDLGGEAQHYILLTPPGGLEDVGEWYSAEFKKTLNRVTHIETMLLDEEAILFDRRGTLLCRREPEVKVGLFQVEGTSIAIGVFEDVQDGDEPQVRVEAGEYFAVWRGEAPHVVRFSSDTMVDSSANKIS